MDQREGSTMDYPHLKVVSFVRIFPVIPPKFSENSDLGIIFGVICPEMRGSDACHQAFFRT